MLIGAYCTLLLKLDITFVLSVDDIQKFVNKYTLRKRNLMFCKVVVEHLWCDRQKNRGKNLKSILLNNMRANTQFIIG